MPKKYCDKETMTRRPGVIPILAYLEYQGVDNLRHSKRKMYHKSFYEHVLLSDEANTIRTAFQIRNSRHIHDSEEDAQNAAEKINSDPKSNMYAFVEKNIVLKYNLTYLYDKVRAFQQTSVPSKTFIDLAEKIRRQPKGFKNNNRDLNKVACFLWQKQVESFLSQLLEFIVNGVDARQKVSKEDMKATIPESLNDVENIFQTLTTAFKTNRTKRQKVNIISDLAICSLVRNFVPKCKSRTQLLQLFHADAIDYIRVLYLAYMMDVTMSEEV